MTTNTKNYDIAIVGSGFGGSLLAMIACKLGRSVLLLERGKHPRFAIGESTSPLTNLLLEQLAVRYGLDTLLPLTNYGDWQRSYPEIGCGLKRGFTFFRHEVNQPYEAREDRSNQLIVAASPCDNLSDTHWFREDVDAFLCREAAAAGADYHDETLVTLEENTAAGSTLLCEKNGVKWTAKARFLVDATSPRGFLSRAMKLSEAGFKDYPGTQTLFSHFTHVKRCEDMTDFATVGTPPYPMDDAALHHVFDGGWMWVLRFGNGITSAGIAVTDAFAEEINLSEGEPAWRRFLARYPSITSQFAAALPVQPFIYSRRLAYRCSVAAGNNWALLPSAAAFIDPLFSTGIPLTILGIERLAKIIEEEWQTNNFAGRLEEYGRTTFQEADWVAKFVGACYASFPHFEYFTAFSMFYFAAASYSEMARRLDRKHLVRRFMAADRPEFAAGLPACAAILHGLNGTAKSADWEAFAGRVAHSTLNLNIAGLNDSIKRNWYDIDLEDMIRESHRLEYAPTELRKLLANAPWAKC